MSCKSTIELTREEAEDEAVQNALKRIDAEQKEFQEQEMDIMKKEEKAMQVNESNEFEFYCKQYSDLNKRMTEVSNNYDSETEKLRLEINRLQGEMSKIKKEKYQEILDTLDDEKEGLKKRIITGWVDKDKKTFKYDFGSFTNSTLTSLEITDKEVLIAELSQKGLLNGAIKSFDESLIKGWIKAKMGLKGAKIQERNSLKFTAVKNNG